MESYKFRTFSTCPTGHEGIMITVNMDNVDEGDLQELARNEILRIVNKILRDSEDGKSLGKEVWSQAIEEKVLVVDLVDCIPWRKRPRVTVTTEVALRYLVACGMTPAELMAEVMKRSQVDAK